ncbi:MAG: FtsX-like permease family protein [Spirochaetaceae bacterium]|nr:FtsX-like permease family protein [Spirochaetaceae bacterium]
MKSCQSKRTGGISAKGMAKIMHLAALAFKYLLRYKRRYLFLFGALTFGFCIVTVIVSVKDGMEQNAYYSAQGHYAGDIAIVGRDSESEIIEHISLEYLRAIENAVNKAEIRPSRTVMRTKYFGDAALFHNGESVPSRYLYGLDWETEREYIESLPWTGDRGQGTVDRGQVTGDRGQGTVDSVRSGSQPSTNADNTVSTDIPDNNLPTTHYSLPPTPYPLPTTHYPLPTTHYPLSTNSILLSLPIAQRINARVGDSVLVEIENRWGQKNTASFVVAGVFAESSIFSMYKSFVSREALNALAGFDEGECSVVGLYFDNKREIEPSRRKLIAALAEETADDGAPIQSAGLMYSRSDWDTERDRDWKDGIVLYPLTLPVYLSDVSNLLQALNILTLLLYVMMLIIIYASAAVTYRLVFHERTREIAAMRAIGFYSRDIVLILTLETVFLAAASLVSGFILARAAGAALALLQFDWLPGVDMFLRGGRMSTVYKASSAALNSCAMYAMLIPAVFFPARKLSVSPLAEML